MRDFTQGRLQQQVHFLRHQFLQEGELPFANVLSNDAFGPALQAIETAWKDRIYSPLITLWVFLGQVLSAEQSCRAAVSRLIAHRLAQGQSACSSKTGAYCQARQRLPEKVFSLVACLVGRKLDAKCEAKWLWKGRRVAVWHPANRKLEYINAGHPPGLIWHPDAGFGGIGCADWHFGRC